MFKNVDDTCYFNYRDKIKDRNFTINDMDHFPLYIGIHNFARKFFIINELNKTLDLTGNIMEFGIWKGSTSILLGGWYNINRPFAHKKIVLFDTFSGISDASEYDRHMENSNGMYKGISKEAFKNLIIERKLDNLYEIVEGNVCETVKSYFENNTSFKPVSFVIFDMDVYKPTSEAIKYVLPNLVPGGKIIFDEATDGTWLGERKALNELITMSEQLKYKYTIKENDITMQPTTVFTRIS